MNFGGGGSLCFSTTKNSFDPSFCGGCIWVMELAGGGSLINNATLPRHKYILKKLGLFVLKG